MELYLVRHGIAEELDTAMLDGRDDASRKLTEEGKRKAEKVAKALRKRVDGVELILHSSYERARETAEIFAGEFSIPTQQFPGLRPQDWPEAALKSLPLKHEKLMLVSHEPFLSSLAAYILTGKSRPIFLFKKSGVAAIDYAGVGSSELLYLLPPKFLI